MGRESAIDSEKCVEINMHSGIVQCLHSLQKMPKYLFDACDFSLLLHRNLCLDSIMTHQCIWKQQFLEHKPNFVYETADRLPVLKWLDFHQPETSKSLDLLSWGPPGSP